MSATISRVRASEPRQTAAQASCVGYGVAVHSICVIMVLMCLALGGCAKAPPPTIDQVHADWSAKISKAITDPARAQQISAQASRLLDEQQSMAADLRSVVVQLTALNDDYGVSYDRYMEVYNGYQTKSKAAQMKFKDGIFALRAQVSAAEWKEITK